MQFRKNFSFRCGVLFTKLAAAIFTVITFSSMAFASEPISLIENKLIKKDNKYEWYQVRLTSPLTGEFKLWHRQPLSEDANASTGANATDEDEDDDDEGFEGPEPLPIIFLLAGIGSTTKNMELLGDLPDAHVFSLDYEFPENAAAEDLAITLVERTFQMQAEALASFAWLIQTAPEGGYDFSRFSSINISFGTFIAPFVLRTLAELEIQPTATVFAFGGAEIRHFVTPFIESFEEADVRERATQLITRFLKPVDPVRHLKYLKGPTLVIRAAQDEIIPALSSDALEKALPEGEKSVVILQTPHISAARRDVVEEMRMTTLKFLKEKGAL